MEVLDINEQEMTYHDDDNNDILRIINLIQESTPLVSYDFLCLTKLVD